MGKKKKIIIHRIMLNTIYIHTPQSYKINADRRTAAGKTQ